ncbi:hypothetical protein [Pseudarthrobacter cellobiosi]|uniref:hypothetical protein n=1 Tax=Pseudarthrobacter cellobiosi TaxID=2953654 RepID=UPI00208E6078|nr:hypothetical protein [Pseudarthrobacter sp. HLT1-5]MCO4256508.1 hypothetical protein [Pseudarthrobacter sp. HLT1-5]
MFPLAHGETATRERAQMIADPYSNELTKRDWTTLNILELEGVAIAPSSSTETRTEDRASITTGMSLYAAPGVDVLPHDRIRARSGLWDVEGEVADWKNALTGWNPGVEFRVRKVAG